jgi:hypothetical protein
VALNLHYQVVQILEIVVIPRKQNAVLLDSVAKVNRIVFPSHVDVGRNLHVMTCLAQQCRTNASHSTQIIGGRLILSRTGA